MTTTTATAAPAKRKGAIHDLGYKRYVGSRRPQSTRWRVITRHQMAHGWKTWWRYKMWVGFALITTIILGAVMVMVRSETLEAVPGQTQLIKVVDGIVFGSIGWYCKIAFLTTLTVGAGVVASDLKTGAFTFYFARPVRPLDYVVGKLAGLFMLQVFIVLVPLLLITMVRLGLSKNTDELIRNLEYVPKALLVGTVGALAYASAALGVSAILENPRQTTALWAALYVIGGYILIGIGFASKTPAIAAIDISTALETFSYRVFAFEPMGAERMLASLPVVAASLAGWVVVGVGIAFLRVRATGAAGIGGGS
jgi:hypothetical protein